MAASVVVGLALQTLAAWFAPLVMVWATATILVSLVRLDSALLTRTLRDPRRAIAIIVWTLLATPLLMLGVVRILPLDPAIAAALVLIAATPPILSVSAYCIFLGLDAALLTLVAVPATVVAIVTLPAFAEFVPGGIAGLSFWPLLLRTLLIVGVALGGAWLARRFVTQEQVNSHAAWLDGTIVLLIAFTALGIVSGLTDTLRAAPLKSLIYFIGAFALNAVLQLLTTAAMWRMGRVPAASAGFAGGCRNIALLLGVVTGHVPADVQLFIVMAQLQLFVIAAPARAAFGAIGVHPR